jgi:hypothetical protein
VIEYIDYHLRRLPSVDAAKRRPDVRREIPDGNPMSATPGIRGSRTAFKHASGEEYALACEALMFDPAPHKRRRICCRMPPSQTLLH